MNGTRGKKQQLTSKLIFQLLVYAMYTTGQTSLLFWGTKRPVSFISIGLSQWKCSPEGRGPSSEHTDFWAGQSWTDKMMTYLPQTCTCFIALFISSDLPFSSDLLPVGNGSTKAEVCECIRVCWGCVLLFWGWNTPHCLTTVLKHSPRGRF